MTTDREHPASEHPLPGGNFQLFIQRLAVQCLMSLGVLENPLTNTRRANLANARMLLEDLAMLREKTRGNLEADEARQLDKMLDDLEQVFEKRAAGRSLGGAEFTADDESAAG
mgnify:CR=1 FL=1